MTPVMYQYRQRKVYQPLNHINRMEPIGDPFGGAKYGEKNGPAVALAASYFSVSAGMAAGGFLGGLMIAGGMMSGLGALTGNKTLTTLGMVAGLAGGVTSFMQSGGFDRIGAAWNAGEGVGGGLSNVADTVFNGTDYRAFGPEPGAIAGNMASQTGTTVPGINDQILSNARPVSVSEMLAQKPAGLMAQPGVDPSMSLDATSQQIAAATSGSAQPGSFAASQPPAWTALGTQQAGALAPFQGLGGTSPEGYAVGNIASSANAGQTGGGLMGMIKENPVASMMAANTLGQGVAGMANASAAKEAAASQREIAEANRKAAQPLNDAATRERLASAAAIEKKTAGIGATSIGKWGTNTNAGPWGKNPDGTPRTPQQYFAYMADRFSAAYGNGVPA